jgi:dTDP-4-dehydrorhamnose reductase
VRIFVTGLRGQLGADLARRASSEHTVDGGDLPTFDITDLAQVRRAFAAARPDVVLHCAALTDVDGASREPETAYRTNGLGARNVAQACAESGASMLYVSTNEVFDGAKAEPYREFDATNPINAYGYSKLAGEWFTRQLLARCYVVRTSWLTGAGGRNFVHRIQQLADQSGQLRVVTDEVASPTFVPDLSEAILKLIDTGQFGLYHFTNAGYCSRFEYARRILDRTGRGHVAVDPITLADYPRPSTPPRFTPLANLCGAAIGIRLRPWEEALEEFLKPGR